MMKKWLPFLLSVLVLLVGGPSLSADICREPVMTQSGLVAGLRESETDTCVWRGIPYAAPPVGELRFRAPQPAPSWSGVREADHWGPRCMQRGLMELVNADPSERMSEDCLYLNIWRPAREGRFPVMVWIHGGAYDGGTGNTHMYWGDRLADFGDVVVVTINYRLNLFGFLAHPAAREEDPHKSTGNYGSLDQVAALSWVHENIAGFGGDPDNITIFGESAGGWSVCTMIATPLNKGLFHKAILESGGCQTCESLEQGYERTQAVAQAVGCRFEDLQCLRNVPAEKLLKQATGGLTEPMTTKNHVDGYLLTASALEMIRLGDYNRVDFLAGSNRDETSILVITKPRAWNARPAQYEKMMHRLLELSDEEARTLAELYPLSEFEGKPRKAYSRMLTDITLACPTYNGLAAAAQHQENTYLYRFDYHGFRFGGTLGALHAMELPFVFHSMDRKPISLLYNKKNMPEAEQLSRIVQGYWVNFAKNGDPNGAGLPPWPRFDPQDGQLQVLDLDTRTERVSIQERCEFWDHYLQTRKNFYDTMGKSK